MKNKILKRVTCGTLAMLMVMSCFTGCGKGGSSSDKSGDSNLGAEEPTHYFKAEYIKDLPEELQGNAGGNKIIGDNYYFEVFDENYAPKSINSYNFVTGQCDTLVELKSAYGNPYEPQINVSDFGIDSNGNVYVLYQETMINLDALDFDPKEITREDVTAMMADEWGYDHETIENELSPDGWYMQDGNYVDENGELKYDWIYLQSMGYKYGYKTSLSLIKYDSTGNEIYNKKEEIPYEENVNFYPYCMAVDGQGNAMIVINKWAAEGNDMGTFVDEYFLWSYDASGSKVADNKIDSYFDKVLIDPNGNINVTAYGEDGYSLYTLDLLTGEKSLVASLGDKYFNTYTYTDHNSILFPEGSSLYEFDLGTGEKSRFMNLLGCGVSSNDLTCLGYTSEGTLVAYLNYYSNLTGDNVTELVKFNEVSKAEWGDKKILKLACDYLSPDLQELVIEANRKNADYMIDVVEYVQEDIDYENIDKAYEQYYTELAADDTIDMVVFNYSAYNSVYNFASKGLLTDLTPYMEANGTITKADIFDSVVSACTVDDRLVVLPTNCSVFTAMAKSSEVGANSGWSVSDAMKLMADKPEGTRLFEFTTREDALNTTMSLNYRKFIDIENGKCDLDNEEFRQILEYAGMYDEEIDFESYYANNIDEYEELGNGSVICTRLYLNNYDSIQANKAVFNDEVTLIGFPTTAGSGALLSFDSTIGITENCDDPQACFDMIAPLYRVKTYDGMDSVYELSIRKDSFDNLAKAWKNPDNAGSTWYLGDSIGDVNIGPATDEEIEMVRSSIENASGVQNSVSSDIMAIIKEEASAYYSGEKKVEEVTPIIQSRVKMYLSETM